MIAALCRAADMPADTAAAAQEEERDRPSLEMHALACEDMDQRGYEGLDTLKLTAWSVHRLSRKFCRREMRSRRQSADLATGRSEGADRTRLVDPLLPSPRITFSPPVPRR